MNNKRLYILFVVLFTLIVVVGFNGRVLSAIAASAQANDHQFVLSPQVRAQFNLNPWSPAYSDYTRITDMEDRISVQVPVEWADIDTGPWTYKVRSSGIFLAASTDLSKFYADGSAPGVLIGVSSRLARTYGKDQLLGMERADLSKRCTYQGSFEFQGLFYQGNYDNYSSCGSWGHNLMVFTTTSADHKSLIMVRIAIQSGADLKAASKILETFQVLGNPEVDPHGDH